MNFVPSMIPQLSTRVFIIVHDISQIDLTNCQLKQLYATVNSDYQVYPAIMHILLNFIKRMLSSRHKLLSNPVVMLTLSQCRYA